MSAAFITRRAAAAGKLHDAPNAAAVGNLPQVAAV
jgi:hypothetical protein